MILIDKPTAMTSFGVVARVRRRLTEEAGKKIKVGHTGTLDPFATGLMILMIGKACKQAQQFSKLDKTYETTIILGKTSTTGDPEGEIMQQSHTVPTNEDINDALKLFVGDIAQTPPAFSAIKINGQRAYKLAREGKDLIMPTRQITIHSLELISYVYPALTIRTHVSSGTYIRTLAGDIGKALKTGAYCSQLRRTKVGQWNVENAVSWEDENVTAIKPLP